MTETEDHYRRTYLSNYSYGIRTESSKIRHDGTARSDLTDQLPNRSASPHSLHTSQGTQRSPLSQ